MTLQKITQQLISELGSDVVQIDEKELYRTSLDNLRVSFMPDAVIHPRNEADIEKVLKLANTHRIPVTTRGAGTATTGSSAPVNGGWVLDMSSWNQVHVDADAGIAFCQPGVVTKQLQDAAEREAWFYPPDPASLKYCTIGGNIATNAGGLRGAKYGVTRDYVMALEGFMPTGEFVRWGAPLKKFSAGFNLKDLWIGSEGMLGVITGIVVKLIPLPETRVTLLASFEDDKTALEVVKSILINKITPSVLEFLDCQTIECFQKSYQKSAEIPPESIKGFMEGNSSILLIELDGHPAQVNGDKDRLIELISEKAIQYTFADTEENCEELWTVRRKCSKAMFQLGDTKLNEDIVIPLQSQQALSEYTLQLKEETGLATPTFGHAADGNFHVHIMYNREDDEQCKRAETAVLSVMEKVIELGGAISGEHGIGLAKTPFINLQHSPTEVAVMKNLKKTFDPNGILNPGKMFSSFRVWEHKREEVKLPWDH